ncbi:RNA polymerase II-specific transcription factor-like protein [Microdochium nivale]|nr:RNA polymerase II-specific transcription factor-like protein [Microdochium nivale]
MPAPAAPLPDAPSTARRKSCLTCTRAKRRCDLGLPLCSRCVERGIACVYAPVVSSRRRRLNKESSSTETRALGGKREISKGSSIAHQHHVLPLDDRSSDIDIDANIDIDIDNADFDAAMLDPCLMGPGQPRLGVDMMNSVFTTNLYNATTTSLPPPFSSSSFSPPPFSYWPRLVKNNTEIAIVPGTKPLIVLPADADALHAVLDPRLHYTIAQFCGAPEQFALSCQTPWSHPLLYCDRLPRSIAIAQACCALHVARGPGNAAMVSRNIAHHARELCLLQNNLSSGARGEDGGTGDPMLDLLAHTQALLLYHIMLHSDLDPVARNTLPLTARALQRAMISLHDRTSGVSSPYPVGSGPLRTSTSRAPGTPASSSPSSSNSSCDPSSPASYELSMPLPLPLFVAEEASDSSRNGTARPMPSFLALSPLATTRQVWHDWIVHESARRSVLMAGMFLMLQILRTSQFTYSSSSSSQVPSAAAASNLGFEIAPAVGEEDDPDPCCASRNFCVSPWTLSRGCWEAADAVDFAVGWNKRAFTVLSCADLELRVHEINPRHVDTCSKMILTLLLGIDETKGWLLSQGGVKL